MAVHSYSTMLRRLRRWPAAACLALLLAPAWAQTALDERIDDIGEQSRFVPDQALRQLRQIEKEARAAPLPTKSEFIAQLSVAHMRVGENARALDLAEELIAYARANKNDAALAKGTLTKAYVKSAMADNQSAHQLAFAADQLAGGTGDMRLRVLAGITAGEAYAEEGNFAAALGKQQMALDLARQHGAPETLAAALHALTLLYTKMKEHRKAFEALDESLRVAEQLRSPGRLALARNNEYGLALDTHQPGRALRALLVALELERKLGAEGMIATTLVNLSDSYLKRFDYPKTLQFAHQAIDAARRINDTVVEAAAHTNVGQALLGMGRLAEGKKSFERGLAQYDKADNKPETQIILREYGAALERAGDLAGAVAAYHRERDLSDQLFEERRQKAVYELQEKYEADKKLRQIELLSRENRINNAELDNRRLQQRVWWLLAAVCALAAVVAGLLYRRVRHANARLRVSNLELKQQGSRDPLTALYNRRHFQDAMRRLEQGGAGKDKGDAGALFLLDVDHFKHVNDSHGHAAGDAVLKMIAEHLRVLLRETDMIVRWGGEEFLAFLPALPPGRIDEVARRILDGVAARRVAHQGREIAVTVSIGFAPFPLAPLGAALPWERMVNLVDMALYLAKKNGRHRAYGVRGFHDFARTSMEEVEQDLERAWQAGFVELGVVPGAAPDGPPAAAVS